MSGGNITWWAQGHSDSVSGLVIMRFPICPMSVTITGSVNVTNQPLEDTGAGGYQVSVGSDVYAQFGQNVGQFFAPGENCIGVISGTGQIFGDIQIPPGEILVLLHDKSPIGADSAPYKAVFNGSWDYSQVAQSAWPSWRQ